MPTQANSFSTFLIIGPTCFFLGILFIMLPYDYHVLWSSPPPSTVGTYDRAAFFDRQELHLQILHQSPPLVARILNLVIGTGILGFLMKLYKPSEANLLFDGASLVLYLCGVAVYIANIVKGLRAAGASTWGADVVSPAEREGKGFSGVEEVPLGREDSLRVLAASNTILALVLVGVLVLQAGQWYAQHQERKEVNEMRKKQSSSSQAASGSGKGKKKNA